MDLCKLFPEIILLYDNDIPGIDNAIMHRNQLNKLKIQVRAEIIPEESDCKDPSDFVKEYGEEDFKFILKKILY